MEESPLLFGMERSVELREAESGSARGLASSLRSALIMIDAHSLEAIVNSKELALK